MGTLINFIEYLAVTLCSIGLVRAVFKELNYYQQSRYEFVGFKKILKSYYLKRNSLLLIPFVVFIFFLDNFYVEAIYSIYFIGVLVYLNRKKSIIKLKITPRISRLLVMILIVKVLTGTLISLLIDFPSLSSITTVILLISPFLVFLTALIVYPYEVLVSLFYKTKARRKLRKTDVIIVGITGSFGKTTTKNILYHFLKNDYVTLATSKSYNTINGISKNINEYLTKDIDIMITELGATKVGDIKELCDFVRPKYGLVTGIAPQHISSFKSIDNIVSEKMSLVENLPLDGVAIINGDDEYLKNYQITNKCKIIRYGFSSDNDYQAILISSNKTGLKFKIKHNNKETVIETKLLGKHNISNILACFALATELEVTAEVMAFESLNLEQVSNRLSVEMIDDLTIIRDDYNSNYYGFISALEVLSYYDNLKVLITPGVVDGGSEESFINQKLSKYISEKCDYVYLVKTKASLSIMKSLQDVGFVNVVILNSFQEAFNQIRLNHKNATILIENDVSDIYLI